MVMRSRPQQSASSTNNGITNGGTTNGGTPEVVPEVSDREMMKLRQGLLSGVREKSPNGGDLYCFRGIPYAKPPLRELRFAPPVPLEKFPAVVLDCSRERSAFVGINIQTRELSGCEDGLFLNVYSPRLPTKEGFGGPLPVMVFIHGGGQVGGSSDSMLYNPSYLVQEGVVVVTFNYRMGVLGLLCLPDAGVEGNMNLKDQRLVLRWVNENICYFGGDPSNVTLFGASSGGNSVSLHCCSPSSRKYFHKAIMQSGHMLCDFAYSSDAVQKSRALAKVFGYSGTSDVEALQVLRKVTAWKLVEKQFEVLTEREKQLEKIYWIPFNHVIERADGPDPVFTRDPMELLRDPDSFGMPIIIGWNSSDGSLELWSQLQHLENVKGEPHRLVPRSLNVDFFGPQAKIIGEEILQHYFKDKELSEDTLIELMQLNSDRYGFTVYVLSYLMSQFQHSSNCYSYRFAFDGDLNYGHTMLRLPPQIKGAFHMDELFYLFHSILVKEIPDTNRSYQMRTTMARLWTNFAKFSNPTPPEDKRLPFRWDPIHKTEPGTKTPFEASYLNIDRETRMTSDIPDRKGIELWCELHHKYNGHFSNLEFLSTNLNSSKP
ncbi:esterase B1-like [Uranotaenia lowii]|uniref:esterase B1-like n=1 Tax=Uranotaenia lowii TaxID=190385 RepID=UPI00247A45A2|nr:esterase B1-like [Uranotaenia lowii]